MTRVLAFYQAWPEEFLRGSKCGILLHADYQTCQAMRVVVVFIMLFQNRMKRSERQAPFHEGFTPEELLAKKGNDAERNEYLTDIEDSWGDKCMAFHRTVSRVKNFLSPLLRRKARVVSKRPVA